MMLRITLGFAFGATLMACGPGGPNVADRVDVGASLTAGTPDARALRVLTAAEQTVVINRPTAAATAEYVAIAPTGAVSWQRELACPNAEGFGSVAASSEVVVCADDTQINVLGMRDGVLAWSRPLPPGSTVEVAAVADRVVAGINDQTLVVFDASTGDELHRFHTAGAWLRGAVDTPAGPMALLVRYTSDTGPGLLTAQPLEPETPVADAESLPLSGAWDAQWSNAYGELWVSGDVVVGTESPELLVARDTASGALRWQLPARSVPWIRPLTSVFAVAGTRDDQTAYIGALDPATGVLLWERAWPHRSLPTGRDDNGDHTVFYADDGWMVVRNSDGTPLGEGSATGLQAARVTRGAAVQVVDDGGRSIRLVPLAPSGEPAALPLPAARPPWFASGSTLHYIAYTHSGADPRSGRLGALEAKPLEIALTEAGEQIAFSWSFDGRSGTRIVPAKVRAEAMSHDDVFSKKEKDKEMDATSLVVSKALLAALQTGEAATWSDSGGLDGAIEIRGSSYAHVQFGGESAEGYDVPVFVAASADGKYVYQVARYADAPLVVMAMRDEVLLVLDRVESSTAEAPAP